MSDTVYSIRWPPLYIGFIRMLVPVNFDFLSITGLGCLVPYNFYDSFLVMQFLPIGILLLIGIVYFSGLKLHRIREGDKFTHAMQVEYTNHTIQFSMWMVLLVYPPLSRRILEFFQCSENLVVTGSIPKVPS